jgi:hypothetical protein
MNAEPPTVESGSTIDVTMHAQNWTAVFASSQIGSTGRVYRDVYPLPLTAVVNSGDVNIQVLSGPSNPILSGAIDLGPNGVTTFTWRYRVQGAGCFTMRGQLGARLFAGGTAPFYSNTAESNQVCVGGPAALATQ